MPYIIILIFFSCENKERSVGTTPVDPTTRTVETRKADKSKYYTAQDTLVFTTELGDTLQYSKSEFNQIIDNHPELTDDYPRHPDEIYYCYGDNADFTSEVGQDGYYVLYAYFLKQKNGAERYAARRKKLIGIYLNINSLFSHFQYGGTYFGHQIPRILGYAEYSIYLYKQREKYLEKTYDITKQKELYINSLRQLIEDESKIDYNTEGQEKRKRIQELNKTVDEIAAAITEIYYLRRAQEFHFGHYEYY